jgi:hypothetical protein
MRNDQMMLRIDRDLHIVADHAGAKAADQVQINLVAQQLGIRNMRVPEPDSLVGWHFALSNDLDVAVIFSQDQDPSDVATSP